MNTRCTIIVTGTVQGVGYREIVSRLARSFGLTGHVMNLSNGTVKIICEGERLAIDPFLKAIDIKNERIEVEAITKKSSRPRNQFHSFKIRYPSGISPGELEIIERLNSGLALTDRLGQKQDATRDSIRTMDSNIGGHFDRLDQKYDAFGASLAQAASGIEAIKGDIHDIKGDIHDAKDLIAGLPAS